MLGGTSNCHEDRIILIKLKQVAVSQNRPKQSWLYGIRPYPLSNKRTDLQN